MTEFNPSEKACYTLHKAMIGGKNELEVACIKDKDGVTLIPSHVAKQPEEHTEELQNRVYFSNREAQALAMSILTQGSIMDAKEAIKEQLLGGLKVATNLCDELSEFISAVENPKGVNS